MKPAVALTPAQEELLLALAGLRPMPLQEGLAEAPPREALDHLVIQGLVSYRDEPPALGYFETFDRPAVTITRWYVVSEAGRAKARALAGV